jgi:hypothetical protein
MTAQMVPVGSADEVQLLRDRVRDLEDDVAELRDLLGITRGQTHAMVMHTFGLSPTQATLACMFYQGGIWTRGQIETALYDLEKSERHPSVVDQHLYGLRRRLERFGIEIATQPHGGWRMDPSMKKRMEEELRKGFELAGS